MVEVRSSHFLNKTAVRARREISTSLRSFTIFLRSIVALADLLTCYLNHSTFLNGELALHKTRLHMASFTSDVPSQIEGYPNPFDADSMHSGLCR